MAAPVIYPGSIERTSFAERTEEKGYVVLTIGLSDHTKGALLEVSFVPLPARPMVSLVVEPTDTDINVLSAHLAGKFRDLDPDSVVRIVLQGHKSVEARRVLSAALLRELAPPTMNISLAPERLIGRRTKDEGRSSRKGFVGP